MKLSATEYRGAPAFGLRPKSRSPNYFHGKANASAIAHRLGMSRRTLARALSAEGAAFSGVLETLRQALAKRYLRQRDLPISEIAWLLGYKEISSFTHAFVRWTGMTPKTFRTSNDVG
jgi:AraC-like DNA-binding protein